MSIFTIHKSPLFLRIVFVLSIFIMLFVSALTYRHIESITKSSDMVAHSYKVTVEIEQLFTNIKDLEIERRNFLLTNNPKLPAKIKASKLIIQQNLNNLKKYTKDNPKQLLLINRCEKLISEKFKIVDNAIDNYKTLSKEQIKNNLLEGKSIMERISNIIDEMLSIEKKLLIERDQKNDSLTDSTPTIIYITLFSTIAIISLAFVKISRDLEETRKNNEQLELNTESNNLAEQIGNYGTWALNLETNEYTFSENEYRLLGVEPFAFKASLEDFMNYIHPEDLEYVNNVSTNMVTLNTLIPFTYRIIRTDGEIRYLRGNGKTVTNKSGERILIGTTNDVTEEVKALQAIEDRSRELEANNKELEAFNYVASHDLQEPLRKIQTFISRLVDKDLLSLSENSQQFLLKIQDSTKRMRLLIDDLLQFSRTNKAEKVYEKSNLNELLENSKLELTQIIEENKASINSKNLPILDVIPFQIQQLFTNLISNSIKYSKENSSPVITIESSLVDASNESLISVNDKSKYYKITFSDNGIGFEQEYAEKIFLLFNRLHNKNEYSGTGIGLSICKKIVENHKGFILAEGKPNIGAKFIIYLPFS